MMAYSVLVGWVYVHTGGSVLVATLLPGAINLSQGFFFGGVDAARECWLLAGVYGGAALVVALVFMVNEVDLVVSFARPVAPAPIVQAPYL